MLIPLGTDRPLRRPTFTNHLLIGLNVGMFLLQVLLQRFNPDAFGRLFDAGALAGNDLHPWSVVTYQFLHGDFLHLAGNMLFLLVFGANLEDRLGRWWYPFFYLVGGAAAGAVHAAWTPNAPVIGASGAVSAVTGAFLVFFPRTIIRVFMFFFVIGVIHIPAMWFIGFQIFLNMFHQGMGSDSGVAYLAHLGGYVYGGGIAYALLALGVLPREPYDLFSSARQARRRRAFRELTTKGHDPWSGAPSHRQTPRKKSAEERKSEEFARRRMEISERLAHDDLAGAADAYTHLRAEFDQPALSRNNQLLLGNYYFQEGRHQEAAETYTIFLLKREKDHETPRVRLMLALLHLRYLRRPEDARALLHNLPAELSHGEQRALAESLLAELEAAPEPRQ